MPAPEGRNTLSNKAIGELRQIRKLTLGSNGDQGEYGGGAHHVSGRWYWAKIASTAMTPGSVTSPTTFTFDVWSPDPSSSSDPVPYIVSTDSTLLGVTGTNRTSARAVTGAVIKVEYSYGEWSPKWQQPVWYWGKTTSAITAASSLSVPSSYTADIWLPTGTTAGGTYAVSSMTNITVYNRDPNFSTTTTGLTGRFEFAWNEWTGLIGCG